MSQRQDDARTWVRSVIGKHLPRTARKYKLAVYTGEATVSAVLGVQIDLNPAEGKVIELTDDWILIKLGRAAEFFVAARNMVDKIPELDATIRITPYARRGFDGRRLDAPRTEQSGEGVVIQSYTFGASGAVLPIDKASLRCPELRSLLDYLEQFDAGDGVRCLSQVLVDAGAWQHPVAYVDPLPEDITAKPPSVKFRVSTAKADGWLEYRYDRAMDVFRLSLTDADGNNIMQAEGVHFDDLTGITVDWIDDGTWRIAKVEIMAPARRRATAA